MNSTEKKKILIVDDEHLTTELAKVILEKNGFSVIIAEDGETALSLAQQENPDLILLDAILPMMDGFTVCKKLKESKKLRNAPILMLTAKGSSSDIERGRAAGADEYIIKPFSGKALVATIIRHLGIDE
jgi:DNA-binding response OmpR family regulator